MRLMGGFTRAGREVARRRRRRFGCCTWATLALTIAIGGCGGLLTFPAPADLELLFNVTAGEPIAVAGEPTFSEQAVFDEIPGKVGSHAPTITAFEDGELFAAWYSYEGPHELDGSAIYTARRLAGEEAWQAPVLHIDRPAGDGNPVLYSEADNVWLFQAVVPLLWSTSHIEVQMSSDRGREFSDPVPIAGPVGSNIRFPPIRTAAGTLLLPAYDDLWQRCLFFTSPDGSYWTLTSAVYCPPPFNCIQPSVVRLDDGRLLAVMRNTGGQWLWVMASDDDGNSWSPPMDSGFANPDSPAALLTLTSGNLGLVYNDSSTERRPLSVALSDDEGLSWPSRRILADGDSNFSYPAAVQTPDGLIHVVYSHGRQTIQHVTLNEAWIVAGQ